MSTGVDSKRFRLSPAISLQAMKGLGTLVGFWFLGFAVGLIGDLLLVKAGVIYALWAALVALLGNSLLVQGLLVGVATGFISMVSVLAWAYLSRER